jgi:hypothetical protein
MKKLFFAVLAIICFNVASFAQAVPATTKAADKGMDVVKAPEKKAPAKVVKMDKVKPAAATPNGAVLKADGTVDKRYKASKNLKADGTPDKRFKANK